MRMCLVIGGIHLKIQSSSTVLIVQVKEVILAYFMLMSEGKATVEVSNEGWS